MAIHYGKLENGELVHAPEGTTREQAAAGGWKPVLDQAGPPKGLPAAPDGKRWEAWGWRDAGVAIVRRWRLADDPPPPPVPPPRTFSKYRLVSALMSANLWAGVKAWIEGIEGAYDLYLAAEDISEDEPLLAQGIAALKAELGITDEQVEALLSASVKDG